MPSRPRALFPIAFLVSLSLLLVLALPAGARHHDGSVEVYHDAVTVTLVDAASDGHQLGDLRVTAIETSDSDGAPIGRLDATLTTTAVDVPEAGDEIRISTLVFAFGDGGKDQVVVGGSALYPAEGPTIGTGAVTTRPILGGSGAYAGASGSAITKHLPDDTWVHVLSFDDDEKGSRDKADKPDKPDKTGKPDKPGTKDKRDEKDDIRGDDVAVVEPGGPAIEEVGISRLDLGLAQPGSAPGEELGLWQYRIPAGSELAPHTHAGWQIARIVRGTLDYTVIDGEGTIIRGDGSSESIGPGSYTLETGDSVVENPQMGHFGANATDDEVIILAATLYPEGAPLSIPIE